MPNFKKLSQDVRKRCARGLRTFVRIPSTYDANRIKAGQPFGTKVKEALDYLAKLGTDFGFQSRHLRWLLHRDHAWRKGPLIGIYGHSDVVPASGSWRTRPLAPPSKTGRLWGRGTADDKGPLARGPLCNSNSSKTTASSKASGSNSFRAGMRSGALLASAIISKSTMAKPRSIGFTPDADYPLIYAEKGIRDYWASQIVDLKPIIAMKGGAVMNAVCDSLLTVTLLADKRLARLPRRKTALIAMSIADGQRHELIRFRGVDRPWFDPD
jgi:succinyl-diaminopimelate desuccinylase